MYGVLCIQLLVLLGLKLTGVYSRAAQQCTDKVEIGAHIHHIKIIIGYYTDLPIHLHVLSY